MNNVLTIIRKFLITASDGKNYNTKHYNLEAIISLGYRINSERATNFRKWATRVLKDFFANVQNKLHFAVHKHTAAELILKRANHKTDYMGLTTWKKAPDGKIIKSDVIIAKNYLNEKEIKSLNRIVTMYLDYAEDQEI